MLPKDIDALPDDAQVDLSAEQIDALLDRRPDNRAELQEFIMAGQATTAELEEHFGPDLMNQLAAQWRGEDETQRLFRNWYNDVIAPIGLDRAKAFALFTGAITIEEYAASLTSIQAKRFIALFPDLQTAHEDKLARL